MPKVPKIGPCALCGKARRVTREHVPPKNLFLPPRPGNTITVPVCELCNHGYHLDDEYFRVFVAALAEPRTRLWRLWKERVVGSSFARSGGLKGRLNADHALLLGRHRQEPLRTPAGDLVTDDLLPRLQPFDASRVNAVVEKIVRCLHFFILGVPLPVGAQVQITVADLTEDEMRELRDTPTGQVGHEGEFVFRRQQTDDHEARWLLAFYEQCRFAVHVRANYPHA